jgi:CRISPR-associated Csx2 family protein
MKTLITFLGRSPKGENGYRKTHYQFDDGASDEVAFFGWSLARRIEPGRLIILGTSGSMWDHLFEGDLELGDAEESRRLELVSAVEDQAVTEEQLNALAPLLGKALGYEVYLDLIPYCHTEEEQTGLLQIMAEHVMTGSQVHIDVTHGFRHQPMLALLSALHLRLLRDAEIDGIWYGAFDPDSGEAKVHELSGLLRIADWLVAFSAFEKDGDYGVFRTLLPREMSDDLVDAAFFERVNRIGQARSRAQSLMTKLEHHRQPDPAAELFYPELKQRLGWSSGGRFYERQRALALQYLERGQYLEATMTGYEAFISGLVQKAGGQPDNSDDREHAREQFDSEQKTITPRTERYRAWDSLRRLRNSVIHGAQPKGEEVQRALSGASEMHKLLEKLFAKLLSEEAQ